MFDYLKENWEMLCDDIEKGVINSNIKITPELYKEYSKKFKPNPKRAAELRKEFEKAPRKNLLMMDLQQLIEQRLAQMLKENPLRIDYYERYQEIVNEYNQDNKKDTIAVTFENLMKLVSELDDEQKRYIAEGFDSDEELTIFDLLSRDSELSKEEIKQVKKLAQTMLVKIKASIHELDHWRDKEETQSIISVLIRDLLWADLPDSYDDKAVANYRQRIFEYIYQTYPAA
jgi:type I restriction enzyme R subunit